MARGKFFRGFLIQEHLKFDSLRLSAVSFKRDWKPVTTKMHGSICAADSVQVKSSSPPPPPSSSGASVSASFSSDDC